MNAKRLRLLAKYIELQPSDLFNQNHYFHSCGTPACIAGHECARLRWKATTKDTYGCVGRVVTRNRIGKYARAVAQESLGLTSDEAYRLFLFNAPWQTAKAACQELRRLAALEERKQKRRKLSAVEERKYQKLFGLSAVKKRKQKKANR